MAAAPGHNIFAPLVSTRDWGGRFTRAEVNLDAIETNVRALRRHIADIPLVAVVKADGYGHGSVAVSRSALDGGANRLAVYTADEAVGLREAGITAPILVFGPFSAAEARAIWKYSLTPTLTTIEAAESLQKSSGDRKMGYHVKVDTGLTRAGVELGDLVPFVEALDRYPALQREGIFTHFARADEREKTSAEAQFRAFRDAVEELTREGYDFPLKHAANSGGIHDLPHTYMNMVRSGISVYGYYPSPDVGRSVPLQPALSLVSAVTRVHLVPKGTGIGYGHEFVCQSDLEVALVPIGYGDGLPRTFGKGNGRVIINGTFVPVIARISMDQITVDVSKAGPVRVGDTVTLIGEEGGAVQSADDVAEQTGTINYDILTGLMPRVPRLYTKGGSLVDASRYRPLAPETLNLPQRSP